MSAPGRLAAPVLSALVLAAVAACAGAPPAPVPVVRPAELVRVELAEEHMGTRFRVVLFARDAATAERAARAALERVAELDARLSDWRPESELSRLCAASDGRVPTPPVPISADLAAVLARACDVAAASDGAFDPTVGPLVALWRRSRRTERLPLAEDLAAAHTKTGFAKLEVDRERRTARLRARGMRLDLGGIAKGFAADEALLVLAAHGIERALVDAGGDVVCGAPPPGRAGWRVALDPLGAPGAGEPPPPAGARVVLELAHAAVATSGDRYQWVEIEGRRYAHLVDPATGLGLERRVAATVVARDGASADAWASALCVAGVERGLALARTAGVEARVQELAREERAERADGGGARPRWRTVETEGFARTVLDSPPSAMPAAGRSERPPDPPRPQHSRDQVPR